MDYDLYLLFETFGAKLFHKKLKFKKHLLAEEFTSQRSRPGVFFGTFERVSESLLIPLTCNACNTYVGMK